MENFKKPKAVTYLCNALSFIPATEIDERTTAIFNAVIDATSHQVIDANVNIKNDFASSLELMIETGKDFNTSLDLAIDGGIATDKTLEGVVGDVIDHLIKTISEMKKSNWGLSAIEELKNAKISI